MGSIRSQGRLLTPDVRAADGRLTHDVVEHVHQGLLSDVPTQVIVAKNGDPPGDLGGRHGLRIQHGGI
ncbi:hypothetical protein [Streptomyces sp. NPDC050528]|uniref:hypothetical protein n=1 Tax=unclassified Streptomyces TaxID=2593676 RepID=UPI0037B20710